MPHSKKYAQKLIRGLPIDVSTLLEQSRYWDETFLDLYLAHCDEVLFYHPAKGFKLAEIAPKLAQRVPERSCPEGQRIHRGLRIRSHVVFAGALRGSGLLDDAEGEFQTASQIRDQGDVSDLETSILDRRLAVLRVTQRRFDEAHELCQGAIKTCRSLPNAEEHLGKAFVVQGVAYIQDSRFAESIPCLGEALKLTKNKNSRTYHAAIHNLAVALTKTHDSLAQKSALRCIREAKRKLRNHRKSLPKYKLTWLEGILHSRVYTDRYGERLFDRARHGLFEVGAPLELGLVSLDLAALLQRQDRWKELEDLAADTFGRFRMLAADTEATAAISMWMDAVRAKKLQKELVGEVRDKLEERMWRQRPTRRKRG